MTWASWWCSCGHTITWEEWGEVTSSDGAAAIVGDMGDGGVDFVVRSNVCAPHWETCGTLHARQV